MNSLNSFAIKWEDYMMVFIEKCILRVQNGGSMDILKTLKAPLFDLHMTFIFEYTVSNQLNNGWAEI